MKDIYEEPSSILRRKMPDVKVFGPAVYPILQDLREVMLETGAVGFAANQIGTELNICIVRSASDRVLEFINPVIIGRKGKAYSPEGCLSIPNYSAIIPRSLEVRVGYQNREGKALVMTLGGSISFRAQHEIDHLNGILIRDYVEGTNGKSGGISEEEGKLE